MIVDATVLQSVFLSAKGRVFSGRRARCPLFGGSCGALPLGRKAATASEKRGGAMRSAVMRVSIRASTEWAQGPACFHPKYGTLSGLGAVSRARRSDARMAASVGVAHAEAFVGWMYVRAIARLRRSSMRRGWSWPDQ